MTTPTAISTRAAGGISSAPPSSDDSYTASPSSSATRRQRPPLYLVKLRARRLPCRTSPTGRDARCVGDRLACVPTSAGYRPVLQGSRSRPVGAENPVPSRDLHILVDESVEPVASQRPGGVSAVSVM